MFKKRVLEVATNEINEKTDISVAYELEKLGRKVTYVHFTMTPKKEALPIVEAQAEIRKKLNGFGISKDKIEQLISHHDEQYLWANIAIVEGQAKKGKIQNISAYLLKAFKDDYRNTETEYTKQQKILSESKAKQQKEEQAAEQRREELEKHLYEEKNAKIEVILNNMTDSEKAALQAEFETNMLASDAMAAILKSKGFDNLIIQGQWKRFLGERFLGN